MSKPMIVLVAVILLAAGIGAYFLLSSSYNQKKPEVRLPNEQEKTQPKEKNTITIKDFTFNPDSLTVKAGDAVTWLNEDGVVHSVKSTEFTSPNIKNGDTFKFQFTKAGTFSYNCGIHPYMSGKVVVE